jgi:hypothetical protein
MRNLKSNSWVHEGSGHDKQLDYCGGTRLQDLQTHQEVLIRGTRDPSLPNRCGGYLRDAEGAVVPTKIARMSPS